MTVKARMELKVLLVLAAITILFAVVYVPEELLRPLTAYFGSVSEYLEYAVQYGLPSVGIFIPVWLLFGLDHLGYGNPATSKPHRFFTHYWLSTYAVIRYGLNRDEANRLFFDDFFNKRANKEHPQHGHWRRSFKRSYTCRLIYYLHWFLLAFVLLAIASTLFCLALGTDDAQSSLPARSVVAFVAFIALVVVDVSNQIVDHGKDRPYESRYTATGAYAKYMEIQGILRSSFEQEVLKPRYTRKPSTHGAAESPSMASKKRKQSRQ